MWFMCSQSESTILAWPDRCCNNSSAKSRDVNKLPGNNCSLAKSKCVCSTCMYVYVLLSEACKVKVTQLIKCSAAGGVCVKQLLA